MNHATTRKSQRIRYGASNAAIDAAKRIADLDSIRPHIQVERSPEYMIGVIARIIDNENATRLTRATARKQGELQ